MFLSYSCRLVCLVAVATGLLQIAFEFAFWMGAPLILRVSESLSSRRRERLLYLVQLAPWSLALFLSATLTIPQYIRAETNLEPESVGWLCLIFTAAVFAWFGFTILRGLCIVFRTLLFTAACKREGLVQFNHRGLPILVLPAGAHRVALAGFFYPVILVSQDLLEAAGPVKVGMDVALDHEYSHATQFDNFKLLLLHFLPRIHFRLRDGRTWMRAWQNSAEWAADDDAVRGDKLRVFLLAEMLVAIARPANGAVPQVLCAQLACGETELEQRIERLLDTQLELPKSPRSSFWIVALGIAFAAAGVVAGLTPWLHGLSERLLHLG